VQALSPEIDALAQCKLERQIVKQLIKPRPENFIFQNAARPSSKKFC
jgi:hypothetical protein